MSSPKEQVRCAKCGYLGHVEEDCEFPFPQGYASTQRHYENWSRLGHQVVGAETDLPAPDAPLPIVRQDTCPKCGSKEWHSSIECPLHAQCDKCNHIWQHLRRAEHIDHGILLSCPWCGDADYDPVGLKIHVLSECEVFGSLSTSLPKTRLDDGKG